MPSWVQSVLGGAEILAAVLFLVPYTARVGSYLLLVILAVAAALHFLHGQYKVGGLVLYAAVVIACMAHQENSAAELTCE